MGRGGQRVLPKDEHQRWYLIRDQSKVKELTQKYVQEESFRQRNQEVQRIRAK